MDTISIEEKIEPEKYTSEICILESTLRNLNLEKKLRKNTEGNSSKIKDLVLNFDVNIINESKSFLKLFESSTYLLNFIINLQEAILSLRNIQKEQKFLKKILEDAELKIQYFENKFVFNYNILSDKYKSIIEEKTNFIAELLATNNIKIIHETYSGNNSESMDTEIVPEIDNELSNINKYLDDLDSIHDKIACINEEINSTDQEISSVKSNNKNLELKQFTIKKLSMHIQNLSTQLAECISEKDEALEELTACNQILTNISEEYNNITTTDNDNNTSYMSSKIEIKIQFPDSGDHDHKAEGTENSKVLNMQQGDTSINIENSLSRMVQNIIVLKNKTSDLILEIRRINGEIDILNKQINLVTKLKFDVEKSYEKNSFELLEQMNISTLKREKLITELNSLTNIANSFHHSLKNSLNIISVFQGKLQNLLIKNTGKIRSYWNDIKQIQIKWYQSDNQLKNLQYTENKLIPSLSYWQSTLEESIINYKNRIKSKDSIELEYILLKLSKMFQDFQSKESKILSQIEFLIIETNFQNSFAQELESIIPGYISDFSIKLQFDTIVERFISKLNDFKNKADFLEKDISNLRNNYVNINLEDVQEKLQDLEKSLQTLCTDIDNLDKDTDQLTSTYNSYVIFNNNKIQELQVHYEQILHNCQIEINSLTPTLKFSQNKLNILKEIKHELSKEIDAFVAEKEQYVEGIRHTHLNLEQNLAIFSEDKKLLNSKLELITQDFIKLKTLQKRENYRQKLDEYQETRNNLKYLIKLIENLEENMVIEWEKTSIKLNNAEESLIKSKTKFVEEMKAKHRLYLELRNEVCSLRERVQSVMNLKNNTEKSLELLNTKISELKNKNSFLIQSYNTRIQYSNCGNKSQIFTEKIDEKLQNLEQKLRESYNEVQEQIEEIKKINSNIIDNMRQIKNLTVNKNNLISKLSEIRNEYMALQQSYRNIIEFETNFSEEIEKYIHKTHDLNPNMQKYFQHRKENTNNSDFQKQMSLFISLEKQRSEVLKRRLYDFSVLKESLCELCLEFYVQIATFSSTRNLQEQIVESIDKLKSHETQLENNLQNLYIQKERLDKHYYFSITEREILSKITKIKTEKTCKEIKNDLEDLQVECISCQNRILENNFMKRCTSIVPIQQSFQFWQSALNFIEKETDILLIKFDSRSTIELIKNISELKTEIDVKNNLITKRENDIVQLKIQYQNELEKIAYLEEKMNNNCTNDNTENIPNQQFIEVNISKNSDEIIAVLNTQLWTTVHKYVDLENENRNLREQLEYYQNNEDDEETLDTLKLYLWITANKCKELKNTNEKLCQALQNLSQANEIEITEISSILENRTYVKGFLTVFFLLFVIITYIFFIYSKLNVNSNCYRNKY